MSGRRGDRKDGHAGQDPRFAAAQTAPLFKTSKKAQHKVKLDDRFKPVLTDERFRAGGSAPIDKVGRKAKKGSAAAKKELEGFYQIEDDEAADIKPAKGSDASAKMSLDERLDYLNRLSRGEIADSSSEDSDDEGDEDEDDDEDDSDSEGEGDKKSKKYRNPFSVPEPAAQGDGEEDDDDEGIPEGESSSRLAIQHCDWENLKAADLYVVLQSFCRPGQSVKRVTVYPSDFGLARMAHEARFGPEGIWKKTAATDGDDDDDEEDDDEDEGGEDEDEDEDEEEDEEDDDGEGPEADYDAVAGINDSDCDEDQDEDEDVEDEDEDKRKKSAKQKKEGDFRRRRGNVGVVLQDELVRRGKAVDDEARGSSGGDKSNANSGLDITALREYELAKLRYYFAVAELDSAATAESLYQQLDGVELEHSSMAFDLRFVPDDVDLSGREVRDSNSGEVTLENYAPPDFIINALQHTEVKCTWEAGEGERERKLTNMSRWRDLAESDLQQFLASDEDSGDDDDDDDDDDDGDEEWGSDGPPASGKAKAKHGDDIVAVSRDKSKAAAAKAMRRALLGDDDEAPRGGEDEDEEGDNFFTDDEPRRAGGALRRGGAEDDEHDTDKVFSYVPEASRQAIEQRKQLEGETPFEAKMRRLAEKKKARKDAKKAFKAAGGSTAATDNAPKGKGQGQGQDKPGKRAADEAELQLMFGDEEKEAAARDYDMRSLAKAEKNKELGKKSKRRRQGKGGDGDDFDAANDTFKVDLSDRRFQPLLEGDSRFGIDPVSVDFKATAGMKDILREQQQRRKKREREGSSAPAQGKDKDKGKDHASEGTVDDTAALVSRLKRRLG